MNEQNTQALRRSIAEFHLPRYRELPDVGLYLDQVVKYINRYVLLDSDKLTPSMVSNYVKKKLIPGPNKKSYGPDSIAYLMFVVYTKIVVPLSDIHFMIGVQQDSYQLSVAYDYFCDEFENLLQFAFGLRTEPEHVGHDDTDEKTLMRAALLSIAHKVYLEKYIQLLREAGK